MRKIRIEVITFLIVLFLSGCTNLSSEKPSDFELALYWHTGSLPPPYDYGYNIFLGPGESGSFNYWCGSVLGELSRDFSVRDEQLAELYSYLFNNDLLRNRWEEGEPIDGGPATQVSVFAGGSNYNIPEISELSEGERAKVFALIEIINNTISPEIWEEMNALQLELEMNY